MTLFYENKNLPADQAQTHALVIGVGDYPHLRGGSAYSIKPAPFTMGLGQLTSPVISAKKFADWLVTKHRNPSAQLGTVELLLSSPSSHHLAADNAPTMANIEGAFDRWQARCNTLKENVAFFYFCGHGVEYETMVLLPEDFGKSTNRPWKTAIDFTKTFYGMSECQAQTQCYFLDACRDSSIETMRSLSFSPVPLKTLQSSQLPPRAAPVLKAAAPGQKAHGPINDISFFTAGLIKCLEGLGADKKVGSIWKITPESLAKSMVGIMFRRGAFCGGSLGEINLPNSTIHILDDPVLSLATFRCIPSEALGVADLVIRNQQRSYTRGPDYNPWEQEVASDFYDIGARFQNGEFGEKFEKVFAYPPFPEWELHVDRIKPEIIYPFFPELELEVKQ